MDCFVTERPGRVILEVVRQDLSAMERKGRRARMLGWWYVCIGGAFMLLGLRSAIRGDPAWSFVFRFVIAVGFFALSVGTLRGIRADRHTDSRSWKDEQS
jgi:hypothetical protein